jgi:putative colanic acid biosynthesis UDP-glucose lipid carrier transferase
MCGIDGETFGVAASVRALHQEECLAKSVRGSSSLTRAGVHVMDWLAFAGAGVLAFVLRFDIGQEHFSEAYALLTVGAAFGMLLSSSLVYRNWRGGRLRAMFGRVTLSWLVTWAGIMTWLVLTKTSADYSRLWLTGWAGGSLLLTWLTRLVAFGVMSWLRGLGVNHVRVLLVGTGETVLTMQQRAAASVWTGYDIAGVVAAEDEQKLSFAIRQLDPDEVWLCQSPGDVASIQKVLEALRFSTANIRLIPDMGTLKLMNYGMSVVLGVPMLDISYSPMSGGNLVAKWLEDKILGLLILLLILPVMACIAVAIKLTSPGPVIFRQKRHGWNGETINVYKFRSMYMHQEATGGVSQAKKGDSRITPLGRVLRSTSLDELPQFLNVLQGSMSIVGPRPHAVQHNLEYREHIPRYMLRHKVKPGITGWAQVNGLRGETDTLDKMEARVQADIYYIENWSVWLDIKIIFLTLFKGFVGKNVY